jgi:hypothetical protein
MSALNLFYGGLRILLMDYDPSVQQYSDAILLGGLQTVIQMGKVPAYALTPDNQGLAPDVANPNDYALITYHTARLFVAPRPDRYSFKTRGFAESVGSYSRYLSTLEMEIHTLENGEMFSSWQSYFAWLHGVAGLPLGEILANFDLEAPLWKATFTRDGMKVA